MWVQWADDLDNAVATFGKWVQARLDEVRDECVDGWRKATSDAAYAHSRSGSKARFRPQPLDRERLHERINAAHAYYVRGIVRKTYSDPHGGVAVWTMQASYDQERDADWDKAMDEGRVTIALVEAPDGTEGPLF